MQLAIPVLCIIAVGNHWVPSQSQTLWRVWKFSIFVYFAQINRLNLVPNSLLICPKCLLNFFVSLQSAACQPICLKMDSDKKVSRYMVPCSICVRFCL